MADHATLSGLLDLARKHGLWIIADEIYSLFHYADDGRAPSFMDIMAPDDRILFVNSFSKNWAMTGWRVGWITIPDGLGQVFENLVQYSTSGVAQFMQKGAVAALDHGDDFIAMQVARARQGRDILVEALSATGRAEVLPTNGAFYLFFALDAFANGRDAAIDILDKTGVGLAPGTAFGAGSERFLRLCFNRNLDHLREAANRLSAYIAQI